MPFFALRSCRRSVRYELGWLLLVVFAAVCVAPAGCAHQELVQLRSRPYNPLAEQLKLYARGGPRPSPRTEQLLRSYDLENPTGLRARKVIPALAEVHDREPSLEICYSLAEAHYIAGKNVELHDRSRARRHYWNAIVRSYEYLFDPQYDRVRNPYDPQFRGACDLYNNALEQFLRIAQKQGAFRPGQTLVAGNEDTRMEISIVPCGFQWREEDYDRFEFVADYRVTKLKNEYHTYGLGVPLIAVRRSGTARPEIEKYYARGLCFPVTAFLRLEPKVIHGTETLTCRLELHDPLETSDIEVAERRIPLESDLSTPLAYFLNQPQFRNLDTIGLLRPDRLKQHAGLYMLQPYQPDKIPVVMIHGLWSSPMTWMEAFNDLWSNPQIREHYQFWFYLYPTGQPYWTTAADLREDLQEARTVLAPAGDSAMDDLVLVGHSMGGLVARLLTLSSGDDFWNSVSGQPFQLVSATDEVKQELERVYFFEPDPSVRRVVTIGSPHRGSEFANRFTQWLARRLITLPSMTLQAAAQLLTHGNGPTDGEVSNPGATSLDALSPRSPILQVMNEVESPDGVIYHNIVGVIKDGPLEQNTDGVVAYPSAHLEQARSEVVVNANHHQLHRHPRTMLEIRRILMEHLAELPSDNLRTVVPAGSVTSSPPARPQPVPAQETAPSGFGHSPL